MSERVTGSALTSRQVRVLECIRELHRLHTWMPTVREIGDALGIRSPNGVECHLKVLVKKGYLIRAQGHARAMRLIDQTVDASADDAPLVGDVAASSEPVAAKKKATTKKAPAKKATGKKATKKKVVVSKA